MYTILADDDLLYVPDDQNYCVSSASISINSDGTSYLDLDIPDTNKTVSKLVSGQTIVRVYWDDELKYKFYVESVSDNLEKTWEVSCNSVKTFLSDTLVRPYSTLSSDGLLVAPSSMNGYFQWLIDEHNNKVTDDNRRFLVGFNGGSFLDRNNYIYRSSTEYPTTESEIEDKILSPYSAYLELTFQNDQNIINLYSDVHETNSQIVELGNTLLDLSSTNSVEDMYTAVIPFGATDDDGNTLTIYSYQDGITKYDPDIVKKGDHIYSKSAVAKYGYKECVYNNSDISVQENLVDRSVKYLKSLMSPVISVDAKAIDQSFLDPDSYAFLKVNQAVRVRSSAHNIDEYFKVCSMTLDLLNPESSNYVFGNEYNTYTGQQSAYLAKLNLSINSNFDIIGSAADAANKVSEAAKEAAEKAAQDALDAQNRAEEAKKNAEEAEAKADEANTKSDEANAKVDAATEKINTAISDAKDAADKASEASKKADEATAKTEVIEKSLTEISGNTDQAIANAQKAQDAADAAKKAADDAQASANESATEIGKVKSQVETINTEIADVKSDATKLRDDLSGQITTVKNTMEADYSRKSDLTETTETLRNEISESAAGVLRTVSTDYATKSELKTTTDATNKNAQDLTTAIKKFDGDINSLQGQIDGSIQTWFYEVVPTDQNEPAVNWTTTDLKNVHLGDLYYDTITGYCYRYQVQNNVYSWQRITDVDVTKALSDAAKAQDTADHKRRVFVSTPTTPYDVGDLWVQGTNGDIMRCQVAKTSSQTYAEADWVKASKYTDDTATNTLSNYVEKTYSTKSEVKQLSDTVSSTVSSLETVKTNAEAAQTSANNAKAAADAAQAAADTAKANAATAQSTADAAKKNLETAQKNLETLQSQANATDADLATAKANVEKAQKAADAAQTAADTAKTNASTAQATADAAKTAASNAQKDVDSLKDRVTKAETSITQNADAIALRATKTEVTSAINDISVGGRNIILDTGSFTAQSTSGNCPSYAFLGSLTGDVYNGTSVRKLVIPSSGTVGYEWNVLGCKPGELYTFSFWVKGTCGKIRSYFYGPGSYIGAKTISWSSQRTGMVYTYYGDGNCDFSVSESWQRVWVVYELNPSGTGSDKYILIRTDPSTAGKDLYLAGAKLEKGNKATDWSPAPEDLESDATTKANNALTSAKSYTDAQLKVTSDSITSTVSKTYTTKDEFNNLSIGGRNLVLKSKKEVTSNEYGFASASLSEILEVNSTYTLSINGSTKSGSTGRLTVFIYNSDWSWSKYIDVPESIGDSDKTYYLTFTTPSSFKNTNFGLSAYLYPRGSTGSATLNWYKLEKGNKATDWTPAPEDLATSSEMTSVKQTVDGLTATISTVKSTADSAKTSTNTLETLIRQSGNGVEVAKKVNGSYTSTKTLMGSDGFYVQDASGNTLSSFGKDTIELGKNSVNAVIKLCGDNAQIKTEPREGGRSTSIFADGGGIGISTSSSNAYSRINAYAGSSSSSGNPTVSYLESATYDGSSNKTIQRLDSHGFSLSVTGGSYINTLSMDHTGLQFAKSTGTSDVISGYINDFVVAQGSSGDWTYRKWASGKAEAWLKFTHTTGTFYLWNSTSYVWYGANIVPSRAYPFTFQTIRNEYAFVTNTAHSVFLVPGGLNSGQTDQYYVVSVTSADAGSSFSVGINIYTVGTWK